MIPSIYDKFKPWSATGSVYIISDTHFDDSDCKLMDANWLPAQTALNIIKNKVHKNDTLIHLGDVGNASYIDELSCYKVLITGNHDVLTKISSHFDEVYTGPLFIADRILLSHEPIYGLENICLNIHGHNHSGTMYTYNEGLDYFTHINLASNICNYMPISLGELIKNGILSKIQNYHKITIDNATKNSMIIPNSEIDYWDSFTTMPLKDLDIPDPCKSCPNHSSNGGNGICNCTLGTPQITC